VFDFFCSMESSLHVADSISVTAVHGNDLVRNRLNIDPDAGRGLDGDADTPGLDT
jgi:hypothetical protein